MPVMLKSTSSATREGEENTSQNSENAVVTARSTALRIIGAALSERFRKHSLRKSADAAALVSSLHSRMSSESSWRSDRTALYASTRHTMTRAIVSMVRATVMSANTFLGDVSLLSGLNALGVILIGKSMMTHARARTRARTLSHTNTGECHGRR